VLQSRASPDAYHQGANVIEVTFNGQARHCESIEAFGLELESFDAEPAFELWLSVPNGASMSMLRNGPNAFLMYLRFPGDSGLTSRVGPAKPGTASFRLSNGQEDEYPLSWCIDLEQCYKALAYFFVNNGGKPDWVQWHKD
jgi:hypothetical protein